MATEDGIRSVRSVRRIAVENRWSEDNVRWVKWAPWNRYRDAGDADGEAPERVLAEEPAVRREVSDPVYFKTRDQVPRDFQIRKEDAERFGYTKGCVECTS